MYPIFQTHLGQPVFYVPTSVEWVNGVIDTFQIHTDDGGGGDEDGDGGGNNKNNATYILTMHTTNKRNLSEYLELLNCLLDFLRYLFWFSQNRILYILNWYASCGLPCGLNECLWEH